MRSSPDRLRLFAALLLSAALHAVLLLPPAPSGTGESNRSGALSGEPALQARIVSGGEAHAPAALAARPTPTPTPTAHAPDTRRPDADQFYAAHELSRAPRPIEDVDLDIPEAALVTRAGTLVLTLRIDASGQVVAYEVDAPGLPEEFATALAETFRTARFSPGEIAGHKVSSILKVEISVDAAP